MNEDNGKKSKDFKLTIVIIAVFLIVFNVTDKIRSAVNGTYSIIFHKTIKESYTDVPSKLRGSYCYVNPLHNYSDTESSLPYMAIIRKNEIVIKSYDGDEVFVDKYPLIKISKNDLIKRFDKYPHSSSSHIEQSYDLDTDDDPTFRIWTHVAADQIFKKNRHAYINLYSVVENVVLSTYHYNLDVASETGELVYDSSGFNAIYTKSKSCVLPNI